MTFKILPKFCASHRCLDDVKNDLHRDDTEITNGSDFDDCFDELDGEMSKITVGTSDTLEESLQSTLVELQHEMREKSSQCTILRETLTTMSATMRRLEFQLKEKETELEEKLYLFEQKTVECERWKSLYEEFESKIENGLTVTNSEVQRIESSVDDHFMLANYIYESYTNRRPWRSKKDGEKDNWDEISASSDSIDEQYCSDVDMYEYECKPKKAVKSKSKTKSKQKHIKRPRERMKHEIKHETLEERLKVETEDPILVTDVSVVAKETEPSESNCTQPEPMPSNTNCTEERQISHNDIEYFPSELINHAEDQNVLDDILNSSWGNIEYCFSEEDPSHQPQREHFRIVGLSQDKVVSNDSETFCSSPIANVDDERRARRLRRRVIRTAKRAARKAQFQCEVVEC